MDKMTSDIIKINDICKQVIYRIFNDNLMQTLKGACINENEEFKYDHNLSQVHPINLKAPSLEKAIEILKSLKILFNFR